MRQLRGWFLLAWVALICSGVVRAHDPGISTAQMHIRADRIEVVTGFAPADAEQFLPEAERTGRSWGAAEFEAAKAHLINVAPQIWELRAGELQVPPQDARVELLPGDNVSFTLTFPRPRAADKLNFRAPKTPLLPAGHRQFVVVYNDGDTLLTKKLLSTRDVAVDVTLAVAVATGEKTTIPASASAAPASPETAGESENSTFWGFLKLGVEHIWKGYDHLLFLFALLVVCRTFKSIVGIITCFTLAHSITLAVATLGYVNLSPRIVEPLIAASIVFVGVENLLRRGEEPKGRWLLTFAFGLVHGFGFASVLRDLGVGSGGAGGLALPLFTFNLGVELGQVAIAAIVLPIVWRLRQHEAFVKRGIPALSAVVAAAGLYWLLERTVLG